MGRTRVFTGERVSHITVAARQQAARIVEQHHARLRDVDRRLRHQVALHEALEHGEGHVEADGEQPDGREGSAERPIL